MDNNSTSGNALKGFVEKIDVTKLNGTPEDFYKAGSAFIENGQFDDGILELVKVVKTASVDVPSFGEAVKELKSLGFSSADISAITTVSESVINLNFKYIATKAKSGADNSQGPKTIHISLSIIYIPLIVIITPYIFSSIRSGYFDPKAYIAEALIIGSIVISRIFLNKGRILIAFLILLSVPGLAFLYFLPGHM